MLPDPFSILNQNYDTSARPQIAVLGGIAVAVAVSVAVAVAVSVSVGVAAVAVAAVVTDGNRRNSCVHFGGLGK